MAMKEMDSLRQVTAKFLLVALIALAVGGFSFFLSLVELVTTFFPLFLEFEGSVLTLTRMGSENN